MGQSSNTSWEKVSSWYNKSVGQKGHYFHEHVVIPNTLRLLNLKPDSSLLDLACGQGVLERNIGSISNYTGIDSSTSLINYAKSHQKNKFHQFIVGDIQKPLAITKKDFTHATIILAIQNIEHPELVIKNISRHLISNGKLLIVMNHSIFRIPRQTSWEVDPINKIQYRRINRYLSPLKIPINSRPSQGKTGSITWSFHHSLSDYFKFLTQNQFCITGLEEWVSDKESEGKAAKMENRGRSEFPMFMAILAQKY